ncbi:hypothetical protein AMECASPLE_019644 [Ameca splendens]|uniref:Uncharacterized protein n=1 Tax=Ameca splendens TaxID=208324 RepID=A0ABV0ZMV0_9TELE
MKLCSAKAIRMIPPCYKRELSLHFRDICWSPVVFYCCYPHTNYNHLYNGRREKENEAVETLMTYFDYQLKHKGSFQYLSPYRLTSDFPLVRFHTYSEEHVLPVCNLTPLRVYNCAPFQATLHILIHCVVLCGVVDFKETGTSIGS